MRRIFMVVVLRVGHMTQAGAELPQDLPVSPEAVQPLLIGSKALAGVLADATGEDFDLGAALDTGPTVLVFCRAHW